MARIVQRRNRALGSGIIAAILRAMTMWRLISGMVLGALAVAPALAHPHLFIDTRIEVILDDQNRATGLRISWTYDDLFSLSVIADKGLDPDWDGKLTEAEVAKLSGFDMHWDAGYPGDTYALMADVDLPLSPPQDWGASYADGKITTVHLRRLETPIQVGSEPLLVQVYDPGFYTAYTIAFDPVVTGGRGCAAVAYGPDLDAADEVLKAALAEYSADANLEADFPAIGKNYSEEVRVTCAAP